MKPLLIYYILAGVIIIAGGIPYSYSYNYGGTAGPKNPRDNYTAYDYFQHLNYTKQHNPDFTVKTDKASYHSLENLYLSGHVRQIVPNQAVTVKLISPLKNLIGVAQFTPDYNGNFTKSFTLSGPLWKTTGTYTIMANYGLNLKTNSTFYFDSGSGLGCNTNSISAWLGTKQYCIAYQVTGGSNVGISDAIILPDKKEIYLNIASTSSGQLTLIIPRQVLDSKSGSLDSNFLVLIDGHAISTITDIPRLDSRVITIPFDSGKHDVDIIGTFVVPEFGVLVSLLLVASMTSVIIFTRRHHA